MTYNVVKITPATQSLHIRLGTLKECRDLIGRIRKGYANALPSGSKRLARWHGKDCIIVHDTMNDGRVSGDEIRYVIFTA